MRWRFGGGPFGACNGLWWVQRGLRLYRLHKIPRGYSAQGLTRKVAGRSETREYRTLYGAKMGVEEGVNDIRHAASPVGHADGLLDMPGARSGALLGLRADAACAPVSSLR